MSRLIVADDACDWLDVPGVRVIPGRRYLTDPAYGEDATLEVFNLCKSYRYQSLGYYVSMLAEARGHRPKPGLGTIGDLKSAPMTRLLCEGLDEQIQRALAGEVADACELGVYFGTTPAAEAAALARQLHALLEAPLLWAQFYRHRGHWHVHGIRPIAASDVPARDRDFAARAARDFFTGAKVAAAPGRSAPALAILVDPNDAEPPSNAAAMEHFQQAARDAGLRVELITRADAGRLAQFDALFIRETTAVNHYTYRLARRAAAAGLVVIDDPRSILRCNNKVYLAELFVRHGIPAPRTLVVHADNVDRLIPTLGLPLVLKQPDSSGSAGVVKIESTDELHARVPRLLEKSALIVAQEYLPTAYDWRVGVLDGRPLFACRYYMVDGHWQIIKRDQGRKLCEGLVESVPLDEAPEDVVRLGLQVANLIGNGLYGVDIKRVENRCCVIEVNDNPNVDAGNEDAVLGQDLYRHIMDVFVERIEERKRCRVP